MSSIVIIGVILCCVAIAVIASMQPQRRALANRDLLFVSPPCQDYSVAGNGYHAMSIVSTGLRQRTYIDGHLVSPPWQPTPWNELGRTCERIRWEWPA